MYTLIIRPNQSIRRWVLAQQSSLGNGFISRRLYGVFYSGRAGRPAAAAEQQSRAKSLRNEPRGQQTKTSMSQVTEPFNRSPIGN